MKSPILSISRLQVVVEGKKVISDLDLEVAVGQVVAITGANGSGKSSLAQAIMGDERYRVAAPDGEASSSKVTFEGKDLLAMSIDERAKAGIFVAWQNPITIPGVSVFSLSKSSFEARGYKIDKLTEFKTRLEEIARDVGLSKEHITRGVNEGFSGGEKKRLELLQLLLIKPKLAILDEIDSGLDGDGLKIVGKLVAQMKLKGTAFILITHNKKLLEEISVDKIFEMKYGKLSTRS